MVKTINIQHTLNDTVDFLDRIIEEGFLPRDYSLEEVENLREKLTSWWTEIEDGIS